MSPTSSGVSAWANHSSRIATRWRELAEPLAHQALVARAEHREAVAAVPARLSFRQSGAAHCLETILRVFVVLERNRGFRDPLDREAGIELEDLGDFGFRGVHVAHARVCRGEPK